MSEKGAIHLHQALHGYADGHRQFAVSTTLKPRDAKALLTLSDSSGPGARFPESGYLTGYPLADSGLYALARTWPAPEMPRPGCVWTHTLLIPFTELGALDDFRDLSNLFRRPQTGSPETYQNVLSWTPKQTSTSAINGEDARYILAALYGDPRRRIVAAPKRSEPENLALAIWGQQWPRLRRSFRFCTFSAADRSIESAAFDLQLVPPGDASIRSRFPKALDADRDSLTSHRWVEIALKDLCSDGEHDLRTFFRRVGGDVARGREAFASLCRLYELLHDLEGATQLANAMSLVDNEFGSAQGRYTRIVITREAARRSRELDEAGFDFLLRNLGFLSAGVDDEILDEVGEQIWTRRPQELAAFLNGGGMQQIAVERGLDALPSAALFKTLAVVPNVAGKVLERRPAVVCEPDFWSVDGLDRKFALSVATSEASRIQGAARALIGAGRGELADLAVNGLGALTVGKALAEANSVSVDDRWLRALAHDVVAVAQLLSRGIIRSRPLLVGLARVLPPDAVPNDTGNDPWLAACGPVEGYVSESNWNYLGAYLLCRALGVRSRSSAELAIHTFERVHTALAQRQMPDDGWRLLESRLPWNLFWLEWDRCRRVREAVGKLVVEHDFPLSMFDQLTNDHDLFAALVSDTASVSHGRAYLKFLRQAMKRDEQKYRDKIKIINRVL